MATNLSKFLFWLAAGCILVAQVFILRSTRRGMLHSPQRGSAVLEWGYAILPGIALALTLLWTWRTMQGGTVRFEARPPDAGVHS